MTRRAMLGFIFSSLALALPGTAAAYDIYGIQVALKQLGYPIGRPDGVYGGQTEKAVRLFQRNNGLAATGSLNPPTVSTLKMRISGYRHTH